jgi:hypothetical protein
MWLKVARTVRQPEKVRMKARKGREVVGDDLYMSKCTNLGTSNGVSELAAELQAKCLSSERQKVKGFLE